MAQVHMLVYIEKDDNEVILLTTYFEGDVVLIYMS